MSKKILLFTLLAALWIPVVAQETADTTYTFRFVADEDMFYVPWSGNGAELDRLLTCVDEHRVAILDGTVPVYVDSYCTSQSTLAENLAIAKIRANRVKTEMILRGGLTEACFTTKNHASNGNYVTVRLELPAGPTEAELEAQRRAEAERLAAEKRAEAERLAAEKQKKEEARLAAEKAEAERLAAEQAERERAEAARLAAEAEAAAKAKPYTFAVRANLLRWVTLRLTWAWSGASAET